MLLGHLSYLAWLILILYEKLHNYPLRIFNIFNEFCKLKYDAKCLIMRTSHSTFSDRPVLACAFLRPLGAIHQCAAFSYKTQLQKMYFSSMSG